MLCLPHLTAVPANLRTNPKSIAACPARTRVTSEAASNGNARPPTQAQRSMLIAATMARTTDRFRPTSRCWRESGICDRGAGELAPASDPGRAASESESVLIGTGSDFRNSHHESGVCATDAGKTVIAR